MILFPTAVVGIRLALALLPELLTHDHERDEEHGREVQEVDEPVARVREDERHLLAAESSHRPRQVKATMTTSMAICDRVARRGSS